MRRLQGGIAMTDKQLMYIMFGVIQTEFFITLAVMAVFWLNW